MPPPIHARLRTLLLDETDAGLEGLAEALKSSPEAREAWKAVREDAGLANAACAAIERSGALRREVEPRVRNIVQDLLTMLKAAGPGGAGFDLLVLAWRAAPQSEVRLRAAQALLGRREPAGLDAVVARLDDAQGNERNAVLQAIFTRDPRAAFDALSPRFAAPSEASGALLVETLSVLMWDIHDEGKAHWGPSRGWFAADPRWRALCDQWRTLPTNREAWGAKQSQAVVDVAGWLRNAR